jgi:hypothetical protein
MNVPVSRLVDEKIGIVRGTHGRHRALIALLTLVAAVVIAAQVDAQLRRGGRNSLTARIASPEHFDGRFQFCRIEFRNGFGGDLDSGDWAVDFPRADINLSIRLSELTRTEVSRDASGETNNVVLRLTAPELFNCPFIMMTEVGAADLSDLEILQLREYLLKGGFLWADDFWGTEAWDWWASVVARILPRNQYPIVEITPDHPLFVAQFVVNETPQIANIGHWTRYGHGMERGSDSPHANTRAVLDRHGRIMVLMTHNTDFGDSFEREADDPGYFLHNSVPGYAFGVNALLYALTH